MSARVRLTKCDPGSSETTLAFSLHSSHLCLFLLSALVQRKKKMEFQKLTYSCANADYKVIIQSWPKKFVLGCVDWPSGDITQPRTNFIGQLCILFTFSIFPTVGHGRMLRAEQRCCGSPWSKRGGGDAGCN